MTTIETTFNPQTQLERRVVPPSSVGTSEAQDIFQASADGALIIQDLAPSDDLIETENAQQDELNSQLLAQFNEAGVVVSNLASETVYAGQLAETPVAQQQLADSLASTVEQHGKGLSDTQKDLLAKRALKALKRIPRARVVRRMAEENRAAHQLVSQRSRENQVMVDDLSDVEKKMKERRAELTKRLINEKDLTNVEEDQLREEMRFLTQLLDRKKPQAEIVSLDALVTPSTDELEAQLRHVTPESVSPARGITIAKLAHATVEIAHKIKDALIPDDEQLLNGQPETKVLTQVR